MPKKFKSPESIQSITAKANAIQGGVFTIIFSFYEKLRWERLLQGTKLHTFLFPLGVAFDVIRAIFAGLSLYMAQNKNIAVTGNFFIEALKAGIFLVAVTGFLSDPVGYAVLGPALFIAGLSVNVLLGISMAAYSWWQARKMPESSEIREKHLADAKHFTLFALPSSGFVVAIYVLMLVQPTSPLTIAVFATLAVVSGIGTVLFNANISRHLTAPKLPQESDKVPLKPVSSSSVNLDNTTEHEKASYYYCKNRLLKGLDAKGLQAEVRAKIAELSAVLLFPHLKIPYDSKLVINPYKGTDISFSMWWQYSKRLAKFGALKQLDSLLSENKAIGLGRKLGAKAGVADEISPEKVSNYAALRNSMDTRLVFGSWWKQTGDVQDIFNAADKHFGYEPPVLG